MNVKPKHFIVIPRDAYNLLTDRYADFDEAASAAKERCGDENQQIYVVELKAVAAKDEPPISLRKVR